MTQKKTKLIPDEFFRVIAILSVIPSYLIAGGFVGYGLDSWLHTFPYITGVGLIAALSLAIKDMYRLKDTIFKKTGQKES